MLKIICLEKNPWVARGLAVYPSYVTEAHNYEKLCHLILMKYVWNQIIHQYYSCL